ncbi:HEAT repeat domain-containing protein [Cellulomonas sp. S1-8]|uniref:HEAT repeat domain-containing protein n=1 Tax=Cellulomonas sp. S1-8 TaxID=2904790 RepID=UPI002244BECA|nr:HEAT repeat domain-containing protein [Cellulomonas sp. S1-8]UZN03747.1 hypothetical protein OKX07_02040 [Cellulomonas sp. S1-8]
MSEHTGEPIRLPDIEYTGPDLNLPAPPDDLEYTGLEDWKSDTILALNGIGGDVDALRTALETQRDALLSAAAHASWRYPALADRLRGLLDDPDDAVRVDAAYALARQGDLAAVAALQDALERPVGPYLSPLTAAGYLAQLGDPVGYPLVRDALGDVDRAVNMLACKQLLFFLPLDGRTGGATTVDAAALFTRAFADPDPDIGEQARAELERSPLPAAARLLADGAR